jgi:hypothetical protein
MERWAKVVEFLHWDSADGGVSFVGQRASSRFGVCHVFTCFLCWLLTQDPGFRLHELSRAELSFL